MRYHPLAWAAVVASGGWAFSADVSATECGPAVSRENGAGDCGDAVPAVPPALALPSSQPADIAGTAAPKDAAAPEAPPQSSVPQEVDFNPAFFSGDVADLSRYTRGNPVLPGRYPVDLSVNGQAKGRYDVQFLEVPGSDIAAPCFTLSNLERMGVDVERVIQRLKAEGKNDIAEPSPSICIPFAQAVPGTAVNFNTADLQLDLTVPQLELRKVPSGYVDPSRWDSGITAGLVQYSLSTYTSHVNSGQDLSSAYLSLQSGLNVGGWRFHQWSNASWQNSGSGVHWQSVQLYAQHDITALKGQLTLGDSSTSGDVFDSFNIRGVQLSSDDRMLPDSVRSYAPVVRGVADTNARVKVRQNGIVVYETSVSPGPFEIPDLPATGYGGDLEVTVTESDGRERRYLLPFAAAPQLLRPGISRYNVSTGVYRDGSLGAQPWVAQAVYQRGLTNLLTAYSGVQASEGYGAALVGVALNTHLGAFAFDVTFANTRLPAGAGGTGYSGRISYSKTVPGFNTNFALAAYRYSTSRFYSLRDAVYARNQSAAQNNNLLDFRTRNRLQLNISQPLGGSRFVYVSGSTQDYWDGSRGNDLQYQAGFSSTFKRVSYTLYAQRNRVVNSGTNTQVGLNLTIPLGRTDSNKHSMFDAVTVNVSRGSGGVSQIQASAVGNTDGVTPITYGINASRMVSGDDKTVQMGGYGTYRAPFGTYYGNASVGNQGRQASLNVNGGIVAHQGGVTLTPPLGQAFALVEAKGAKGGTIINGQGATIDRNGYAVIPQLTPYRVNSVALDPQNVPLDVELGNTSEEVVPRADSLVFVKLATVQGRPTFAEVEDAYGKSLPMGADLIDASGKSVGMVGQGGMAYLRGIEGNGKLRAKWGAGPNDACVMPYSIPPEERSADGKLNIVARVKLHCDSSLMWAPLSQQASDHASEAVETHPVESDGVETNPVH
ncbi:fimbria/pilus outer membrane usher protein [Trinickia mobilis]|uniref:fimbria/pilus outer membrane usher protein n=1 Tax=Trinickia mobilis TaxID=2816356 RepID=UPI001F5C5BA3|nr:fimbria/pilus outer membrane usher protein [Trinickia mobilis]